MTKRIKVLTAGFFLILSSGFSFSDEPDCLRNDRYVLTAIGDSKVVLEGPEIGRQEFDLDFTILFNEKNPEMKLRPLEDAGVRYNVPTWMAADPATAAGLSGKAQQDEFSQGDGFDSSILKGDKNGRTDDLFQAAPAAWVSAQSCSLSGNTLRWSFEENGQFTICAEMTLPAGNALPVLTFRFTPLQAGYYSVGYTGAPGCTLAEADEIWQPLVWQEKRFPQKSYLTLAYHCPVPSAFVTQRGVSVGVVADSKEFPFDPLPLVDNSRFGIAVHDAKGLARPMLFAPALGGEGSLMQKDAPFQFTLRLFAGKGDTTYALEQVATELYGFKDYRSNAVGSLNRTIDNMMDYAMSHWSLFSEENKGCNYSTDAPGAVKNVSSIDPLDLSIVMDNADIFKRRAYPYMEYMLSRGKFLFTTDESQKIQYPAYRLNGPAAPISELGALYSMFHEADPVFRTLATNEYGEKRVRNLDEIEDTENWWTALTMYRAFKDVRYLDAAKKGADEYIKSRVDIPQTGFNGSFFWTGFAPRYMDLLMLYEATGEKRYLDAAQQGARRYAQYIWFSPAIPDQEITVNKGGKAPVYWYLKSKGHAQVLLPEETVPAWRLSEIGLTPESSLTSSGHRAIFMANHAPWMLKIGYLANDPFLMHIARSAVIGRYRNFPGYHMNTARTTAYEKENFPLCGHKEQSVNSFHYNHIFPMLSMLLDYLVTDAYVRSGGEIDFPYNYSEGYAYLQNKAYGAMTGRFYGHRDALLWMPQRWLSVPEQINYIAARGSNNVYVALMNESTNAIQAQIEIDEKILPEVKNISYAVELIADGNPVAGGLVLKDGQLTVPVSARGFSALVIRNLVVTPRFQNRIADLDQTAAWNCDLIGLGDVSGRAMILNLGSQNRTAYIFLEYSKPDFTKVELVYDDGTGEQRVEDDVFPWEFTVPVSADAQDFSFILNGYKPDGSVQRIVPPARLKRNASKEELEAAAGSLQTPLSKTIAPSAASSSGAAGRSMDWKAAKRCKGSLSVNSMPEALRGTVYVQAARGEGSSPGAGYSFTTDKETVAYIAVQNRGTPAIPAGWKKTDMEMQWGGQFQDGIYETVFPAGRVVIPEHTGKQGSYGVPHMVFLKSADGSPVKVSDLSSNEPVATGLLE